jgi:peptidoglycan/xylan/chitin deacetylase (PgdA/CDA1 family)
MPLALRALRTRRVPPWPWRALQRTAMKRGLLAYETHWLKPLQQARREALGSAAEGPPRFLVRVDEFPYYSGFDDPTFGYDASVRFHAVMAEHGVKYLTSVVPQWTHDPLNPAGTGGRPLDARDEQLLGVMAGDGVSFAQHGHTHRTRFTSSKRRSELVGLGPKALVEMLEAGKRQLAAVGIEPRVLVPPFNRFAARQWPILASRFDVITGGPETVLQIGFHGGPQWRGDAIYLPCYEPLYGSASTVLAAAESLLGQRIGTWIPITLHMGWEVEDGYRSLRQLARLIAPYAASWEEFLRAVDGSRERAQPNGGRAMR